MEQHPVPQQISSYSFKLVGDMTLKQFFEIGGGVLVGIVIYATGLPAIIKWPLILISVLFGGALAFIPFEERPLEQWIFAFFRSIYSPTLFYWKKLDKPEVYFQPEAVATPQPVVNQQVNVQNVEAVPGVSSEAEKINYLANLENTEKAFLSKIGGLFKLPTPNPIPQPQILTPEPKVEELKKVVVPQVQPQKIEKTNIAFNQTIGIPANTQAAPNPQVTKVQEALRPTAPAVDPKQVQFSVNAAPPTPTTVPNTIVGQVMDEGGKIIEGAILEIKDSVGRPARAVRTNKAGHFTITIPFSNGKYEIFTEKDGYIFEPLTFEAKGALIPSFAIKGKVEEKPKETDIFKS